MYWYILFVRTGREHKAEQLLKERLDTDEFVPFIPMLEAIFKISGQIKKELKPLFPSYVFIESELPSLEFIKRISRIISNSKDIIRFLRYGDTDEVAMREHEKNMLLSLCNGSHCIESSSGIIEGDRIYIKDGPLKGWESIVRKVDRHKRQAWIEIELMGSVRLVSVGLEIVEKVGVIG